MKICILALVLFLLSFNIYGQNQTYTGRKGLNLPGHLDIAITIDDETLRYELFNHWYTDAYTELRQIIIPINDINKYNSDSIAFKINGNFFHLIDKKYNIDKRLKISKRNTSIEKMRKISYAYKIAKENGLKHYDLYKRKDLELNENEFYKKVNSTLETVKIKTNLITN